MVYLIIMRPVIKCHLFLKRFHVFKQSIRRGIRFTVLSNLGFCLQRFEDFSTCNCFIKFVRLMNCVPNFTATDMPFNIILLVYSLGRISQLKRSSVNIYFIKFSSFRAFMALFS